MQSVCDELKEFSEMPGLKDGCKAFILGTIADIEGDLGNKAAKTHFLWQSLNAYNVTYPIWKADQQGVFNKLIPHLIWEEKFYKMAIDMTEEYVECIWNEMWNAYEAGNDEVDNGRAWANYLRSKQLNFIAKERMALQNN